MYFSRLIKQKREIRIDKETPERREFITEYRTINNKGSYSELLIKKYHECIKEKDHKSMMEKLHEYKQHLESFTNKPPLQVCTYLNQKRYNDTYEITKVDFASKWQDEVLRERKIPKEYIEMIMLERDKRVAMNPKKEVTTHVFDMMIEKYYLNNQ